MGNESAAATKELTIEKVAETNGDGLEPMQLAEIVIDHHGCEPVLALMWQWRNLHLSPVEMMKNLGLSRSRMERERAHHSLVRLEMGLQWYLIHQGLEQSSRST